MDHYCVSSHLSATISSDIGQAIFTLKSVPSVFVAIRTRHDDLDRNHAMVLWTCLDRSKFYLDWWTMRSVA